jgi:hypothetical protein
MLAFGREVYLLRHVAPGATIQVHTTDNRLLATELKKNIAPDEGRLPARTGRATSTGTT